MRPPLDDVVATVLAAEGPAETYAGLLDTTRAALAADQAVLVCRDAAPGSPAPVHRSPADSETAAVDARELVRGAADRRPGEVFVLQGEHPGLGLVVRARHGTTWILGLARARGISWTPADREALAALGPSLALGIAVAMLGEDVAAERARELEAESMRQRLLATLSHELRNPLAPILMWTSTLKRLRAEDTEVLRGLQAIEHSVALARRLIEDLTDVSRLERGAIELRHEPVDLRETVLRAIERSREPLAQAGLSVTRELPPDAVPVEGDPARLFQVVDNLIGNAVKFTPPDGRVAIVLARRGENAELRVSDTGPGLAPDVRPRLFMPFVQGRNARGGLGVGLAIARRLVALHRGGIEALPEGDLGGTTIVVTVPLRAPWQSARTAG